MGIGGRCPQTPGIYRFVPAPARRGTGRDQPLGRGLVIACLANRWPESDSISCRDGEMPGFASLTVLRLKVGFLPHPYFHELLDVITLGFQPSVTLQPSVRILHPGSAIVSKADSKVAAEASSICLSRMRQCLSRRPARQSRPTFCLQRLARAFLAAHHNEGFINFDFTLQTIASWPNHGTPELMQPRPGRIITTKSKTRINPKH